MGKGSQKKIERAAEAAAKAAALEEAQRAHEQRARRNRIVLMAIPLVTAALATLAYLVLEDRRAVAFLVIVGLAFWVPALLGAIGAGVPPRDRARSGSIDFGRRD